MSVIFGIREAGRIVIAGDKRGSKKDGRTYSDNMSKVVAVNEHLAFASAGNAVFEKLISMKAAEVSGKASLTTDDLAEIVQAAYREIRDMRVLDKLKMPSTFYFLIAGKSRSGGSSLISGGNFKGSLDAQEVEMILYPPEGADMKQCCELLAKNYKLHHTDFAERTVREISRINPIVSPTGDRWNYDVAMGKGILHSF